MLSDGFFPENWILFHCILIFRKNGKFVVLVYIEGDISDRIIVNRGKYIGYFLCRCFELNEYNMNYYLFDVK